VRRRRGGRGVGVDGVGDGDGDGETEVEVWRMRTTGRRRAVEADDSRSRGVIRWDGMFSKKMCGMGVGSLKLRCPLRCAAASVLQIASDPKAHIHSPRAKKLQGAQPTHYIGDTTHAHVPL
jgi:hypothetical protein